MAPHPPENNVAAVGFAADRCGRMPQLTNGNGLRKSRTASPVVREICFLIRAHYDQRLSVYMLAARIRRNAPYAAALFRRQTGMTIHRYTTRIRMRRAALLLRRSEKVEAVMLQVGYRGKKNFYRQFSIAFGVTPGAYKACRSRAKYATAAVVNRRGRVFSTGHAE